MLKVGQIKWDRWLSRLGFLLLILGSMSGFRQTNSDLTVNLTMTPLVIFSVGVGCLIVAKFKRL